MYEIARKVSPFLLIRDARWKSRRLETLKPSRRFVSLFFPDETALLGVRTKLSVILRFSTPLRRNSLKVLSGGREDGRQDWTQTPMNAFSEAGRRLLFCDVLI